MTMSGYFSRKLKIRLENVYYLNLGKNPSHDVKFLLTSF